MLKKFVLGLCVAAMALVSNVNAQVVYYDNAPDEANGYSQGNTGAIGIERWLLDDFTVGAGETWSVNEFYFQSVWGSGADQLGTGMLIEFYNDAAGTPDVAGGLYANANVSSYTEDPTGGVLFSRNVQESTVGFDTIDFTEGTYWFRAQIQGPENNFWMTAAQLGSEAWTDYDGVLAPGTAVFGGPSDINFRLSNSVPEPASFGVLALCSLGLIRRRR